MSVVDLHERMRARLAPARFDWGPGPKSPAPIETFEDVWELLPGDVLREIVYDKNKKAIFQHEVEGFLHSRQLSGQQLLMMDASCIKQSGGIDILKLTEILSDHNGSKGV
jgi:hypothetical protein